MASVQTAVAEWRRGLRAEALTRVATARAWLRQLAPLRARVRTRHRVSLHAAECVCPLTIMVPDPVERPLARGRLPQFVTHVHIGATGVGEWPFAALADTHFVAVDTAVLLASLPLKLCELVEQYLSGEVVGAGDQLFLAADDARWPWAPARLSLSEEEAFLWVQRRAQQELDRLVLGIQHRLVHNFTFLLASLDRVDVVRPACTATFIVFSWEEQEEGERVPDANQAKQQHRAVGLCICLDGFNNVDRRVEVRHGRLSVFVEGLVPGIDPAKVRLETSEPHPQAVLDEFGVERVRGAGFARPSLFFLAADADAARRRGWTHFRQHWSETRRVGSGAATTPEDVARLVVEDALACAHWADAT